MAVCSALPITGLSIQAEVSRLQPDTRRVRLLILFSNCFFRSDLCSKRVVSIAFYILSSGRNFSFIFKTLRIGTLCYLVMMALAFTSNVLIAQNVDVSGGTLGQLLKQVQGGNQALTLQQFLLGAKQDDLDSVRKRNLKKLKNLEPDGKEIKRFDASKTDGLTSYEWFMVQKYCEGRLSEEEKADIPSRQTFSLLERDYCVRVAEGVLQYGYDTIGSDPKIKTLPVGQVPDSYVMGVGDEIITNFLGMESRSTLIKVDREGRLNIPDWAPINAAGRTFNDVREEIKAIASGSQIGTKVFVSLGGVRAVSVYVLGEVITPGRHQLTALSNILDAIGKAGGVKKTGSLRRIQLQRGDEIYWFDSYNLLYSGLSADVLKLRDGDRIIVPTLGATFALVGDVLRPAIYELPEGEGYITVAEGLSLGAGTIRPRGNRYMQISVDNTGGEQIEEHANLAAKVRDGDVLRVIRSRDVQLGGVHLEGHVRVPGRRSLAIAPTIADLIGDPSAFSPNPYLIFSLLETADPATLSRRYYPVNLQNIIEGKENYALRDGDKLIVLGLNDVNYLTSSDVHSIISRRIVKERSMELEEGGKTNEEERAIREPSPLTAAQEVLGISGSGSEAQRFEERKYRRQQMREISAQTKIARCPGLGSLIKVMSDQTVSRYKSALVGLEDTSDLRRLSRPECPKVFKRHPDIMPILLEHVVAVTGAVREPGILPVTGEIPITTLVTLAGGFARNVDLTRVEVSRYIVDTVAGTSETKRGLLNIVGPKKSKQVVMAGDVIRLNTLFTDRQAGTVLLAGEFIRPGRYEIRRGEKLSGLMARAGGLTSQAYPYGAVFSRKSVRIAQRSGLRRASRELNSALAVAAVQRGVSAGAILGLQRFAKQLGEVETIGRVVIEADPTVLQVRPELDSILEAGDKVFMPKRPNFVSVIGDVLNPGAMQFIGGTSSGKYIEQAGGFQNSADEDRVFVVYPNGVAQPLALTVWNYNPVQVPPGSTLVVPKDPAPLDLLTMVREGSQLLGQLAVTAASLAVISNN